MLSCRATTAMPFISFDAITPCRRALPHTLLLMPIVYAIDDFRQVALRDLP